jgi:hypothetical protein
MTCTSATVVDSSCVNTAIVVNTPSPASLSLVSGQSITPDSLLMLFGLGLCLVMLLS